MHIPWIFLSGFVKLLFDKMTAFASSKLPTFAGIDTQLTNWTNMLCQIQDVLIDAEEKQMTVPAVNLWLDDLQDLAYDLDDIMDEFTTEALRQSLKAKPPKASSSKEIKKKNGDPATRLEVWMAGYLKDDRLSNGKGAAVMVKISKKGQKKK